MLWINESFQNSASVNIQRVTHERNNKRSKVVNVLRVNLTRVRFNYQVSPLFSSRLCSITRRQFSTVTPAGETVLIGTQKQAEVASCSIQADHRRRRPTVCVTWYWLQVGYYQVTEHGIIFTCLSKTYRLVGSVKGFHPVMSQLTSQAWKMQKSYLVQFGLRLQATHKTVVLKQGGSKTQETFKKLKLEVH